MLFDPKWNEPSREEIIETLAALFEAGSQVSAPSESVSRASYRYNPDKNGHFGHGVFTMDCRPKDMYSFNKRLADAEVLLAKIRR